MKFNIHAGMRVLYKHNGQWQVGELEENQRTVVSKKGLFLFIIPREFIGRKDVPYVHDAEINDIFFDAVPVDEGWKAYEDNFMTKAQYCDYIESDDFDKRMETAWVSDGEFYYYPISKYTRTWLEKQPFNYVVRMS